VKSAVAEVSRRLSCRLRRSMLAATLFCVSVSPVVAQEPDALSKLDQNSRFAIDLLIDSARVAGLPTGPLLSKALEGINRKAENKKIVQVVRRKLANLRTAREVLGSVPDDELDAAATVLDAGAKPAQLSVFRQRQKGRSDVQAFVYWADLIARGVPSEDASSAITKLWQEGADDATFESLWKSVNTDILQGLNPGAALQNRIRETPGRAPPSKPTPPEGQQENQRAR
jgi:hypothetical protein